MYGILPIKRSMDTDATNFFFLKKKNRTCSATSKLPIIRENS